MNVDVVNAFGRLVNYQEAMIIRISKFSNSPDTGSQSASVGFLPSFCPKLPLPSAPNPVDPSYLRRKFPPNNGLTMLIVRRKLKDFSPN